MYLGVSLREYQLFSNYSEFGRHSYYVIHGANYTFYVTNIYLTGYCDLIGSTSSTSTIYYGHQTLTLKMKGRALPDYLIPADVLVNTKSMFQCFNFIVHLHSSPGLLAGMFFHL